jgi:hypothetical protein
MTTRGVEWPRQSALTLPSEVKRPSRGPQKYIDIRDVKPPTMWITVVPAKSTMPMPRRGFSRSTDKKPESDQTLHIQLFSELGSSVMNINRFQ